jgi:hypothetical protein
MPPSYVRSPPLLRSITTATIDVGTASSEELQQFLQQHFDVVGSAFAAWGAAGLVAAVRSILKIAAPVVEAASSGNDLQGWVTSKEVVEPTTPASRTPAQVMLERHLAVQLGNIFPGAMAKACFMSESWVASVVSLWRKFVAGSVGSTKIRIIAAHLALASTEFNDLRTVQLALGQSFSSMQDGITISRGDEVLICFALKSSTV